MQIEHVNAPQYANATSRRSKATGVYRTNANESNGHKDKLNNRLMYGMNRSKGWSFHKADSEPFGELAASFATYKLQHSPVRDICRELWSFATTHKVCYRRLEISE